MGAGGAAPIRTNSQTTPKKYRNQLPVRDGGAVVPAGPLRRTPAMAGCHSQCVCVTLVQLLCHRVMSTPWQLEVAAAWSPRGGLGKCQRGDLTPRQWHAVAA